MPLSEFGAHTISTTLILYFTLNTSEVSQVKQLKPETFLCTVHFSKFLNVKDECGKGEKDVDKAMRRGGYVCGNWFKSGISDFNHGLCHRAQGIKYEFIQLVISSFTALAVPESTLRSYYHRLQEIRRG